MIQEEVSKTKNKVILVVDGEIDDLNLIEKTLSDEGYKNILMASSGSQAISIIDDRKPDLILLDIMLPDMDAFEICRTLHENKETSDIPIIMLTAKISSIDLKRGFEIWASDYIEKPFDRLDLIAPIESVLKKKQSGDKSKSYQDRQRKEGLQKKRKDLENLVEKLTSDLEQANERLERAIAERKQSDGALQEIGDNFSTFAKMSADGMLLFQNGKIVFANRSFYEMFGYEKPEIVGKNVLRILSKELEDALSVMSEDERKNIMKDISDGMKGKTKPHTYQLPFKKKTGKVIFVEVRTNPVEYHKKPAEIALLRDITISKRTEDLIRKSEERYSTIVKGCNDGIVILDGMKLGFVNQNAADLTGYAIDELYGMEFSKLVLPKHLKKALDRYRRRMAGEDLSPTIEIEVLRKDGHIIPVELSGAWIEYQGKNEFMVFVRDITGRKKMENSLRESEEKYSTIVEKGGNGIVIVKGLKIVFTNQYVSDLGGYTTDELYNSPFVKLANPKYLNEALDRYRRRMAGEDVPPTMELEIIHKDGHTIPVEVNNARIEYQGGPADVVFVRDITDRKKAEAELKKTMEELERSNKELEQFAYVASHDLQEPLRMVSSYVQLLSRRYKGKLDSDADEFIYYAVDGAKRMQETIKSLLTYSRVGTSGKPFEKVDCSLILDRALENLTIAIEESISEITFDKMPIVMADRMHLIQLFQNLIGNAIKYCGEDLPRIHISCDRKGDEWVFSVKDNGIGIDHGQKDQIFQIFNRLHKKECSGTGIGLSVCKKIVERHGGRIWVESEPEKGSTFYFTLPVMGGEKN